MLSAADSAPLNILMIADYPDDPRLGSAKVVHKLRDEFVAAGHVCDVILSDGIGRMPASRHLRQLAGPALAGAAVRRAFRSRHYDVVDAASAEGLWVAAARRAGFLRRTAVVCRSNGLEHLNYRRMLDDSRAGLMRKPWTRRIWFPLSRLTQVAAAARAADRLIVLNDGDAEFARSRGWQPAHRIDVVPHGLGAAFLQGAGALPSERRGVLFCGSWDHVKGVSYLVAAFDLLAERGTALPLTVLGPGLPAAQVLASFSERARPFVTVIDRTTEERVRAEYARHEIFVLPSTYEGFGLVVIEAMSQGLAVIATPVGCARTAVRHGETGLLVPARDAAALAAAIRRLADDPSERTRIGAAAAHAVSHLSWRRTAADTLDVYRRALENARP
jgi:glycosyltransferase involved in cell wall biosynthesis